MVDNSIDKITNYCNGKWKLIPKNKCFNKLSKDSRTIKSGDIYIALNGENFDGNDFIDNAFNSGAVAAIATSSYNGSNKNILFVEDPLSALQKIGIQNRKKWSGETIGITGSAGKTTIKELCSSILFQKFNIHKTFGNYNNHIGLPLTLSELELEHECLVAEIGMSKPGEIKMLAEWLKPNIAILSDIGLAHSANFDSLEHIVHEKCGLLEVLNKNDIAILDIDSPWFNYFEKVTNSKIITISLKGNGDINGTFRSNNTLEIENQYYQLPQPGEHMARNTIKAIALAKYFNISANQIQNGLKDYKSPSMRWEELEINNITWINDSYNANPLSMRAALNTFENFSSKRKIVIIGRMHELGSNSEHQHKILFDIVDNLNINEWILIGNWDVELLSYKKGKLFDNIDQVIIYLKRTIKSGDSILLKASRVESLDKIINYFK